jgi:NAD(P) transhydrogenase subunit beta
MSANQLALWYLVAAVSFILALKGLSSPHTARRGNVYGMAGMAIALLVTLALVYSHSKHVLPILGGMASAALGAIVARRVQNDADARARRGNAFAGRSRRRSDRHRSGEQPAGDGLDFPITFGHKLELFIGTFIGAITFSGSVIAFGKLSGRIRSAPVVFVGQHYVNLAIGIAMIGFGIWFCASPPEAGGAVLDHDRAGVPARLSADHSDRRAICRS